MVTGSAPIDVTVLDYLKIVFCVPIMEGYGLTESSAGSCITNPRDPNAGHVGGPINSLRIRLKDVPEMSYLSTDKPYPRGEICMMGPSIFSGYFLREDKTQEAFEDGWFRTGDVAQIYPNGSIKIIDRSKNIFKLSQGEYIAPEKLENIFVLSPFVEQSFVYGDSLKNCVVAIVYPDQNAVKKFKESQPEGTNVLESDEFKKLVLDDMNRLATEHHCSSLEKPKAIHLISDAFTVDNDLLTPTFKLKRNIAKNVFQAQIDKMYEVLTAAGL